MPICLKTRTLGAKIETTSGTAIALTGADCSFNAYDVKIEMDIESEEREAQGSFGTLAAVPGGYKGKATFKIDCGWDGTATEPSWADTFLPGCGWVKSGQVFTPRSEGLTCAYVGVPDEDVSAMAHDEPCPAVEYVSAPQKSSTYSAKSLIPDIV